MDFNKLKTKELTIAVIGLGYVGLPLAVELSNKYNVLGFDINQQKIQQYKIGNDVTEEVGNKKLKESKVTFTYEESKLSLADIHIVSVPTPINSDKTPDLTPIIESSKLIAKNMKKNSIVIYESTVYPGTTEEICVPILEEYSGMSFENDFSVGYSPERINPGDKVNTLTKIKKVVSGSDIETLSIISDIYSSIITAGIHQAESIKVAEAAKVIENSQRDINIAFMNELSIVFNKMNINTDEVLKAAGTKWNFLDFKPGLVGGHCIGVDPYYFVYKAEQLGYHSQIILAGRKINDEMGKYVASTIIKKMTKSGINIYNSEIGVLGITFKENCGDVRNSKVIDIINELNDFGVNVTVYDPRANKQEVFEEYGIKLVDEEDIKNLDSLVVAVSHEEFKALEIDNILSEKNGYIFDLKNVFDRESVENKGYSYWSL
ncbi:nucleotide sugar dehydrogenase [Exiguobacterium acetylicum]|uniref:nucleotide sugar dehydrogenase n=1 Tax=Exiguobacterium acetylicum TaxID=41170 RepID=UPI0027DF0C83|nr:nucleotide sugar dehydrogenase [Exiguobacterium acetylicum]MDQ6467862.1 nucleotide sugar dehydrogenase [Exiguobacterium acetylicum]